ncbi:MAG: PH domain-containing protein [Candidatus Dormibacteria bacterium]
MVDPGPVTQGPPPHQAPALAGRWSRLHPLSPVARFGVTVGALLLVALPQVGLGDKSSPQHIEDVIPWLALAAVALVSGVVSWLVTRWRVVADELQIETGLIRRQSLRFPLRRVQAIDVVAPLTARLLGLAEVRIVSAGTGAQHGRLAYLRNDDAAQVRAQLLALAHGLAAETPEPAAAPLFQVDNGALLASVLLRGTLLVVLAAAVVAAVIAATVGAGTVELLTTALTLAAGGCLEAARTFNADFDFTIGESPDGLRLHRGLLQKRHETIPYGRIQAVRLLRPLPWRPFGWVRVELDVARQAGPRHEGGEVRQVSRLLAPVASRQQALWLVSRVFPGAQMEPGGTGRPPRRAVLRAPLSYHYLRLWHDSTYLVTQTGRVRPATVAVPLEKVQSIRLTSGPLLRLLRLAHVRVDTAGRRWVAEALCRDREEASALVDELAGLARRARARRVTVGAPPP